MAQCRGFVQCNMAGFVAFDLVLRLILAGMMDVAFVVHVARMGPDDAAADAAGFGVPGYVIACLEFLAHGASSLFKIP